MVKHTAVPPYHGYHSGLKRNQLWTHATAWMHLKGIMLSAKKKISKDLTLYDSMCITF